jgi:hypothetical protein
MYFTGQNLLYTFHRSLTAQHITVAAFKRYARSPENRTFKKYFRKTNPFTKYMRQRPENALSRYIAKHRRKQNPILTNCTTRITTTIMETLQNLQICTAGILPAGFSSQYNRCHRPCPEPALWLDPRRKDNKTQNKPIYKSVERERHDGTPCANESTGSSHPVTSVPGFCFFLQTGAPVL